MALPVPNQSSIQSAIVAFIASVLPGVQVIEGFDSRVPEPQGDDFVIMTVLFSTRLGTNITVNADVCFTGSISTSALTVSNVKFGTILPNSSLWGAGVAPASMIVSQTLGSPLGGPGVYAITPPQVAGAETMAAGNIFITGPSRVRVQLDFHSATPGDSADMARTVSTLFRSEVATDAFDENIVGVSPLYADEPRQIAFVNAEQQYETTWIVDADFQVNAAIEWQQQFASALNVTIKPPVI